MSRNRLIGLTGTAAAVVVVVVVIVAVSSGNDDNDDNTTAVTPTSTTAAATAPAPTASQTSLDANAAPTQTPAAGTSTPSQSSSSSGGTVSTSNAGGLGTILVDSKGDTLYVFDKDTGTTSTCSGACAASWPPLETSGKPTAGTGVTASMLGTTHRSDGKTQVTYNGHPLYTFTADQSPGQANGQGVDAFGALWYVIAPSGDQITSKASSASSSQTSSTSSTPAPAPAQSSSSSSSEVPGY